MAIFGKKAPAKKATTKKAADSVAPGGLADVMKTISAGSKQKMALPVVEGLKQIIRRPRVTEKAANLTTNNVFTFDVMPGASKHDIVRAIKALYKVTPRKVAVVNTIGKKVSLRTRRGFGVKNAARKAYVYLKAGDKIDFA
ncbi:MAG: 50S ribosomal protein L23 [Patescibacteria group bacterium]